MATHTLYRPQSWVQRLIGFLLAVVAFLVLASLLALAITGAHYELTRTTRADVEAMVKAEVPERATTEQVYSFFESRNIEDTGVKPFAGDEQRLVDAGVAPGTPVISGTFLNDGYAIKLRDVVVTFILDAEGLLQGYLVYETGR
jgi:hypothetical protein